MLHTRLKLLFIPLAALLLAGAAAGELAESFDATQSELEERGWRIPPNAELVPARGAAGKTQALKIKVAHPIRDARYAGYSIPVTPGKHYQAEVRIKTRGVRKHAEAGDNRGAVLFLQLADKDKKHVTGGTFVKGLFGDNDWTTHRIAFTTSLPPQTAYISVLVGIEGVGEAWFDDLRVTEIGSGNIQGVGLLSPRPGERVGNLRPEFVYDSAGTEAVNSLVSTLQVSQNPDFPEGETIAEELTGSPHRLTRWLTPGEWHYRIIHAIGGNEFSPPPSRPFVVADDARAWPPLLQPRWEWTAGPRPTLGFLCSYPGADPLELSVTVNGQQADIVERDGDRVSFRPTSDLSPGAHSVRIEARRGDQAEVLEGVFSNQEPGSRVSFRSDRMMLVDGEPFFPLGTYRDPSDSIRTFDGILQAGFNLTHAYLFEEKVQDIETARQYLDDAHARGLKVFMGLPRSKVRGHDIEWIQRWVSGLMDHPALLLWYVIDEPELHAISPTALRQVSAAVRAVDPFHPATVVYCKPDQFVAWVGAHDLHWNDPYPLPYSSMTKVEEWTQKARQIEGEDGPVWTVLQGHDLRYWPSRDSKAAFEKHGNPSQPTREQTRFMAFQALAAGSDGLVWYWLPKSAYHIVNDAPGPWNGIVDTIALFKELEPWLVADATSEDGSIEVPEPFGIWSREANGRRVAAVMNASDQEAALTLDVSGLGYSDVSDFESGAAVPLDGGRLSADLAPWEVRLFDFR